MRKPKDTKKRGDTDGCKEFWVKKKKPKHLKDNFLFNQLQNLNIPWCSQSRPMVMGFLCFFRITEKPSTVYELTAYRIAF